ncbi:Lipase and/or Abhydrolase 6 domain containing protein [Asbolus verrucosus]|uniref:Lipase and/or Abhydrolase 6 domain containing protein n=1 Tax=Asbolus verrucosus TaxID=1661398 RepID=A0A482WC27_ASBVE|nr:Lipase and/or Abhydrolase 6 domain containing protein [Asbolus verrucosus]
MNVFICLLILIPFVFAGPAEPGRIYFPEEDDPDFKRFIHVENDDGKLELVDLRKGEIKPRVLLSDVSFDLYTRKNKYLPYTIINSNVGRLASSEFDPNKISMFVVHGWTCSRFSSLNRIIRQAALENHDINVFIVDWSRPASGLYLTAQSSVVPVGQIVGNFINQIQDVYGLTGSSFVLVGHSLGAHVVGNAGAVVKNKIGHIIGMDPAGPLFTVSNTGNRLDSSDADFVQIIHTNGALLGFASSIGHADYYPNGGMLQPGCGLDATGLCAHSRSYEYYAESLTRGPVFQAIQCSSYYYFQRGSCAGNKQSPMGQLQCDVTASGDFFLETNARAPYGKS